MIEKHLTDELHRVLDEILAKNPRLALKSVDSIDPSRSDKERHRKRMPQKMPRSSMYDF